jgi:hypothetical protein
MKKALDSNLSEEQQGKFKTRLLKIIQFKAQKKKINNHCLMVRNHTRTEMTIKK